MGPTYCEFHIAAWWEILSVVKADGEVILNTSDHIRHRERQVVTQWHYETLLNLGGLILVFFSDSHFTDALWLKLRCARGD